MGWVHAGVAVTAQLLLALLLVFLGRMRTWRAEEKFSGRDNRRDPRYLPWILVPAVLVALALVLWLTGGAEIGWWRLGVAAGVLILIAAVSKTIAEFYRRRLGGPTQCKPAAPESGARRRGQDSYRLPGPRP